jgi:hypothetical protein
MIHLCCRIMVKTNFNHGNGLKAHFYIQISVKMSLVCILHHIFNNLNINYSTHITRHTLIQKMISGRDNFNILSETIYLVEIDFLNIVQTIVHRGKNGNLQLIRYILVKYYLSLENYVLIHVKIWPSCWIQKPIRFLVINILAVIKNACENTYFCVTKDICEWEMRIILTIYNFWFLIWKRQYFQMQLDIYYFDNDGMLLDYFL